MEMKSNYEYTPIESKSGAQRDVEMSNPLQESTSGSKISPMAKWGALFIGTATIATVLAVSFSRGSTVVVNNQTSTELFDSAGRYVLRDYDQLKPMSNFLAGLGGKWGFPMWAFYVNRGQGITSFGKMNKDGAIAKFNTAEKAYQQTPFTGFRTFVKGTKKGASWSTMPFFPSCSQDNQAPVRNMMIGTNEMEIEETSEALGLKTNILYFTAPDQDFPALIRSTTFTNLDTANDLTIEVLDGLGKLIPAGLNNAALEGMGRTMEAWMNVYNVEGGDISEPFFHISQGTADTSTVQIIKDGYFSVAFFEDGATEGVHKPLPFIVDPTVVFGTDTTLTNPSGFFGSKAGSIEEFLKQPQGTTSRTPCAFAGAKAVIPAGQSVTITSVYGHAADLKEFLNKFSPAVRASGYTKAKHDAALALVDTITERVETSTNVPLFDAYVKQDFLDNALRGGLPLPLGDPKNPKIYHTFSRIHGDIERDYNWFQIDTSYFSQGPGNFRDVNQNRRLDVFYAPVVGDFNVRMFLSFVQADGFNPLTVATTNFKVPKDAVADLVAAIVPPNDSESEKALTTILSFPFRVGQLFNDLKAKNVKYVLDREELLTKVINAADQVFAAQFAQNGYWADHWTYTMDLVDNYLSIFPDKKATLLYDSKPIPFFMSPAVVKTRAERYTLVDDPDKPGSKAIRVKNAIVAFGEGAFPATRKAAMQHIWEGKDYVADWNGAGGVWQQDKDGDTFTVSVLAKLAILGSLKFSTLDPFGMGVEMEGGKPGWNDAMNGLPGILGSGMPETYEMLRIIRFVRASAVEAKRAISLPTEFATFLSAIEVALDAHAAATSGSVDESALAAADFQYWDASNNARETYREAVVATFSSALVDIAPAAVDSLFGKMVAKTEVGIARALALNGGLSPTYFYYDVTDYEIVTSTTTEVLPAPTHVRVLGFKVKELPLFLEGPTRHFKVETNKEVLADIYTRTKSSSLYDAPLKMFLISESLKGMSQEIGRMMAFSPGWLENQSVWLHMSYKFYLEILRAGLYEAFFAEMKTGLVPFMDNTVYGRSPLEASSFIVSSAFPDPKLHGSGYLARLSGSTAEFLSMWAIMMAGPTPFSVQGGALQLKFAPVLPSWLFTDAGEVSFTFLGQVKVTYHNPTKADTWTVSPSYAVVTWLDGRTQRFEGAAIAGDAAATVRSLGATAVDVFY